MSHSIHEGRLLTFSEANLFPWCISKLIINKLIVPLKYSFDIFIPSFFEKGRYFAESLDTNAYI